MNFTTFNVRRAYSAAPILAGLAFAFGGGVLVASAQTYVPLAPLPIGAGGATPATYTLSSYLTGAIKLLVASAGAVAVVMLIIGGTQYVAAGINPSAKGDAKERIWNAIIGLTLVLTSYLILNSIDPRLVQFNLALPPVGAMPTSPTAITASPTAPPPPSGVWPDDANERSQLAARGVGVKTPTCTTIGQTGCTSVSGLGQSAINGLGSLKSSCSGCSITVTGGTEYWLHSATTRHRPGNSVVDIRRGSSPALDAKIVTGTALGAGSCSNLGQRYSLNGAIYVNEGGHWHVCY
jgi:hypothetical protein